MTSMLSIPDVLHWHATENVVATTFLECKQIPPFKHTVFALDRKVVPDRFRNTKK